MSSKKFEKLKGLCDRYFINSTVQSYAGANRECIYCGAMEQRDGKIEHSSTDCPVVEYSEILTEAGL